MILNISEKQLDSYIYRVTSLERLLEMFATNRNVLVKPELWEDTFENFILKSEVKSSTGQTYRYNFYEEMYGQCWTRESASDAMWRIYSPNKDCLRIRTTIRKLIESMYSTHPNHPGAMCCIGKVEYLNNKKLMERANSTFEESGISVENLFRSLLIKRRAFRHENEVRILFHNFNRVNLSSKTYSYSIDAEHLIDQIMIDPRRSQSESETIKKIIRHATGYRKSIKRSLLYSLPKDTVVEVKGDRSIYDAFKT